MPFEICAKRLTYENYKCKILQVRKADLETCAPIFSILWGFNCLLICIRAQHIKAVSSNQGNQEKSLVITAL